MKVSPNQMPHFPLSNQYRLEKQVSENIENLPMIVPTGIGIEIRHKGQLPSSLGDNSPSNPAVSQKVVDALDLGFIKFNARERVALAQILGRDVRDL